MDYHNSSIIEKPCQYKNAVQSDIKYEIVKVPYHYKLTKY